MVHSAFSAHCASLDEWPRGWELCGAGLGFLGQCLWSAQASFHTWDTVVTSGVE